MNQPTQPTKKVFWQRMREAIGSVFGGPDEVTIEQQASKSVDDAKTSTKHDVDRFLSDVASIEHQDPPKEYSIGQAEIEEFLLKHTQDNQTAASSGPPKEYSIGQAEIEELLLKHAQYNQTTAFGAALEKRRNPTINFSAAADSSTKNLGVQGKFKIGLGSSVAGTQNVAKKSPIFDYLCGLGELMGQVRMMRKMGVETTDPILMETETKTRTATAKVFWLINDSDAIVEQEQTDANGNVVGTPLLYAAAIGHAGLVDYMIKQGADTDRILEGKLLLPGLTRMIRDIPDKIDLQAAMEIGMPDVASFRKASGVIYVPEGQSIEAFKDEIDEVKKTAPHDFMKKQADRTRKRARKML